ncbi:hypothetical protein T484DRAFT_1578050, partial [Baffinella frigidus]
LPCGVDTYSDNGGTSPCTACPAGQIADEGASACTVPVATTVATCIPGEYFNSVSETCRKCAIGTLQGLPGQTSCRSCP